MLHNTPISGGYVESIHVTPLLAYCVQPFPTGGLTWKNQLLVQIRDAIYRRHVSRRTEDAYVNLIL